MMMSFCHELTDLASMFFFPVSSISYQANLEYHCFLVLKPPGSCLNRDVSLCFINSEALGHRDTGTQGAAVTSRLGIRFAVLFAVTESGQQMATNILQGRII